MDNLQTNDHLKTRLAWAIPEQLSDVWQLQEKCQSKWSHPKSFFEESVAYNRLLLAWDGDTPIAYLVYQVLWGNTAFLSLVKVLPEYQHRGIGTAMVELLEERLISLGFRSYVTSSETVNQQTKRLLPSLEFAQIGELEMAHGKELFYLKQLS